MASVSARIIFVLLAAFAGGIAGMLASPLFLPENAGLTGGAIVFWCGVIGFFIALALSLFFNKTMTARMVGIANIVLGIFAALTIAWFIYRINAIGDKTQSPPPATTIPKNAH